MLSSGVGGSVTPAQMEARELVAPAVLGLDTRIEFRQLAAETVGEMEAGTGRLVIDLTGTRTVDSAGLGVLMLVHRHASERRIPVVLRNPNDELRFLLTLTRLDDLFTIQSGQR